MIGKTVEAMSSEIYANEPRDQMLKRHRRLRIWGSVVIVAVLIGIQFLPVGISRDNPPVVQEPQWDSETTRTLAVRACYDCHSNETVWPWYSYVAPGSWLMAKDVHNGREVLNFSEWTPEHMQEVKPETAVELVSKDQMPLPYYEILHPEARLSNDERGQLINGLIETLDATRPAGLEADERDDAD